MDSHSLWHHSWEFRRGNVVVAVVAAVAGAGAAVEKATVAVAATVVKAGVLGTVCYPAEQIVKVAVAMEVTRSENSSVGQGLGPSNTRVGHHPEGLAMNGAGGLSRMIHVRNGLTREETH